MSVPTWLYRNPEQRRALLEQPFTPRQIRRTRLRLAAAIVFVVVGGVVASRIFPGVGLGPWMGGIIGGAAAVNWRTGRSQGPRWKYRWKQVLGLEPPDDDGLIQPGP
jgi:hypothetical protein